MSPALLALSACTFALGFAEFVAVSLVPAMAAGTGLGLGAVGLVVGVYAIGVSIGAPVLSAWLASAPRLRVLAVSMLLFAVGNAVTALSNSLPLLLGSRLLAGLMHGVVLALAASTAASTAGPARSGQAIATVFGGLTLALVLGVPLGTLASGTVRWQAIFSTIALLSAVSAIALLRWAPASTGLPASAGQSRPGVWATVSNLPTLMPVATTALAYAGSFTGFTYIAVLLAQSTHLGAQGITGMFALYGVSAAVGNTLGGRFVDRVGSRSAALCVVGGLALAMLGAALGAASALAMAVVMVVWGLASFGAVPVLQKTVLVAAQHNPVGSPELASGMNIAAFNLGIAVGSVAGGIASTHSPQMPMWVGMVPLFFAAILATRLAPAVRSIHPARGEFSKQGV